MATVISELNADGTQSLSITETSGDRIAIGSFVMPSSYQILTVNIGFQPRMVTVYLFDDYYNFHTYSTVMKIPSGISQGYYYQQGGDYRSYSLSSSGGQWLGHVTDIIANGFIAYPQETYFFGRSCTYIAIGDPE